MPRRKLHSELIVDILLCVLLLFQQSRRPVAAAGEGAPDFRSCDEGVV
jgi:hypothetical protein